MAPDFLSHLARLRDSAIVNNDMKSVNKYNDAIDDFLGIGKQRFDCTSNGKKEVIALYCQQAKTKRQP